ncbi:biotin/lipoyl-containing protein [Serpentinicella alkaliphila]|uniref:Biotin-dependent enzyme n=1 Tax=Serpentinicella alkaliphila TaxID=1734049 RepID=A0A4R2TH67_9FIRM|nr:biotin/lipoyl-containing protein [Serpentinicella alkaliphila]QUH25367.1 biotin/lipoyl-binding protein [Serpentinicella alkaliphila]TCQ01542.1 biotin-dependent enzyme [Serpentinicella alkaliphila]
MRKFYITVNGVSYEVEVEEITEGVQPTPRTVTASPNNSAQEPMKPTQSQTSSVLKEVPSDATIVDAPMQGNAWKVLVKEGDKVKKGQVLIILEAMKMENEIMSPIDGVIASVNVVEGASVNGGDVLVSIK